MDQLHAMEETLEETFEQQFEAGVQQAEETLFNSGDDDDGPSLIFDILPQASTTILQVTGMFLALMSGDLTHLAINVYLILKGCVSMPDIPMIPVLDFNIDTTRIEDVAGDIGDFMGSLIDPVLNLFFDVGDAAGDFIGDTCSNLMKLFNAFNPNIFDYLMNISCYGLSATGTLLTNTFVFVFMALLFQTDLFVAVNTVGRSMIGFYQGKLGMQLVVAFVVVSSESIVKLGVQFVASSVSFSVWFTNEGDKVEVDGDTKETEQFDLDSVGWGWLHPYSNLCDASPAETQFKGFESTIATVCTIVMYMMVNLLPLALQMPYKSMA